MINNKDCTLKNKSDLQLITENQSFYNLIKQVVETEEFCKMKFYKHHYYCTTYEHSIKVAYLCYKHYLRGKEKINLNELIRSALLHDYFLYDHHDKNNSFRLYGVKHAIKHAKQAVNNAKNSYADLTITESDAIMHHMFPLTPIPPKTKCGWLVCWYDKVVSICEFFKISVCKN